jgi:predicted GNAT superfamily acetyltransferase
VLTEDDDGAPHLTADHLAPRMLVQVPTDIEALRRDQPEIARGWLDGIRATLAVALDAGHRVTGITRDGWYVVTADRDVAELA